MVRSLWLPLALLIVCVGPMRAQDGSRSRVTFETFENHREMGEEFARDVLADLASRMGEACVIQTASSRAGDWEYRVGGRYGLGALTVTLQSSLGKELLSYRWELENFRRVEAVAERLRLLTIDLCDGIRGDQRRTSALPEPSPAEGVPRDSLPTAGAVPTDLGGVDSPEDSPQVSLNEDAVAGGLRRWEIGLAIGYFNWVRDERQGSLIADSDRFRFAPHNSFDPTNQLLTRVSGHAANWLVLDAVASYRFWRSLGLYGSAGIAFGDEGLDHGDPPIENTEGRSVKPGFGTGLSLGEGLLGFRLLAGVRLQRSRRLSDDLRDAYDGENANGDDGSLNRENFEDTPSNSYQGTWALGLQVSVSVTRALFGR